jgi:hypothetical protein
MKLTDRIQKLIDEAAKERREFIQNDNEWEARKISEEIAKLKQQLTRSKQNEHHHKERS